MYIPKNGVVDSADLFADLGPDSLDVEGSRAPDGLPTGEIRQAEDLREPEITEEAFERRE